MNCKYKDIARLAYHYAGGSVLRHAVPACSCLSGTGSYVVVIPESLEVLSKTHIFCYVQIIGQNGSDRDKNA
jgi:hypothetical protein